MERYQQLFKRLENNKEGAFVPFVTLGDPNPTLSLQIIDTLVENGADALELGIPFSDPLADGPTIQSAALRAFASGVTPTHCFEMLAAIRQKHPDIPIGLLMYANLVFHGGIDAVYQRCAQAGVDSVLIADVPFEESAPFRAAATRHGIAPIYICPPNADEDLLREISSHGRGYTYLLSRAGVTGTESRRSYRCTIWSISCANIMRHRRCKALVSLNLHRSRMRCKPGPPGQSLARQLLKSSNKIRRNRQKCWPSLASLYVK